MRADQVRQYIIQPVLKSMGVYSPGAGELLLLTMAQESHMGEYIHQLGAGPALGPYQMEPATHDDCWTNYLKYKTDLATSIRQWVIPGSLFDSINGHPMADQMIGNLYYATAMCRVRYLRALGAIPDKDDVRGLAAYYKQYYNTPEGAATIEEAISNYQRYVKEG